MDRQMRHFGYGHAWPEAGRHNYQLTSSAVDVRVQYWPDFDVSIWVLFGACALGWRQVATWETPGGIAAQVAEARWMAAWAVSPHALNDFRQLDYEQNGVGAKPPAETSKRSESASNTLATLESRILDYMASHKRPLSAGEIRDGLGANFGVVGYLLPPMVNAGQLVQTSAHGWDEYILPEQPTTATPSSPPGSPHEHTKGGDTNHVTGSPPQHSGGLPRAHQETEQIT